MTKNRKKFTAFFFLLSKTTIYLSLGLQKDVQATEEAFGPHKSTSSTSKQEIFFLLLCVIFDLLDPNPDSEFGYGSTDLIESGSGFPGFVAAI
jgi:hypothetical protein